MKTPLCTEVDLGSGHIVVDGVQVPRKGHSSPPSFRPMSIAATVAHLGYTAELLFLNTDGLSALHYRYHKIDHSQA